MGAFKEHIHALNGGRRTAKPLSDRVKSGRRHGTSIAGDGRLLCTGLLQIGLRPRPTTCVGLFWQLPVLRLVKLRSRGHAKKSRKEVMQQSDAKNSCEKS
jgi:hypothetical protein